MSELAAASVAQQPLMPPVTDAAPQPHKVGTIELPDFDALLPGAPALALTVFPAVPRDSSSSGSGQSRMVSPACDSSISSGMHLLASATSWPSKSAMADAVPVRNGNTVLPEELGEQPVLQQLSVKDRSTQHMRYTRSLRAGLASVMQLPSQPCSALTTADSGGWWSSECSRTFNSSASIEVR